MASCWPKARRTTFAPTRRCAGSIWASGSIEMLTIEQLNAWYGPSHVLQGIDMEVRQGEIVCLIGRNGAGKTTTLRSVMGLMPRTSGRVVFAGEDLMRRPAHRRHALGLAYVP